MLHDRQRLPLLLETGDHLPRIHPQLDDLQRHAPPHRPLLLRHPNRPKATLAKLLDQPVSPDALARRLRFSTPQFRLALRRPHCRLPRLAARDEREQQRLHLRAPLGPSFASRLQIALALRRGQHSGVLENFFQADVRGRVHGKLPAV